MESTRAPRQVDRKRRNQKPRVLFSCTSCREKKLKCDRRRPCHNCLKRCRDGYCRYLIERSEHEGLQNIQSRLQHVENRLMVFDKSLLNSESSKTVENELVSVDVEDSHTRNAVNAIASKEANEFSSSRLSLHSQQIVSEDFRFINPSHWQSIMYHATDELRGCGYETSDRATVIDYGTSSPGPILLRGFGKGTKVQELLAALPSREKVEALVLCCLNSGEPALILIHRHTFETECYEFWKDPANVSLPWLALLFGMLSLGIMIEHTVNPVTAETRLPKTFDTYKTQCAVALTLSNYTVPGRYKVEAAALYVGVEILQANNVKTGISVLVGVVSRLAIVMGYHRDPGRNPNISIFDGEMRRRTWLLLLFIDHIVAWQTGLPQTIQRKLGDTARPRNLSDHDINPSSTVLPPSRPESPHNMSNISYMVAIERMLSVASEVTDTACDSTPSPENTLRLNDLLEATWIVSLSPNWERPRSLTEDDDTRIKRLSLEMTKQRARCILHRQYLVAPKEEQVYETFRWNCVDAARKILEYQSELFQEVFILPQNRHRVWFETSRSVSDCMTAAMVICLEVINQNRAGHSLNEPVRAELIQLLKVSHASWRSSSRPSPETAKAAEIVATMLRLMEADKEKRQRDPSCRSASMNVVERAAQLPTTRNSSSKPASCAFGSSNEICDEMSPQDMFDWAFWDREIQQLNDVIATSEWVEQEPLGP